MCVIIAAISKHPTLDVISQCYKENPHGIGIATRQNGKVSYYKGMNVAEAFTVINTLDFPYILHFRLASAGSADDFTLNHPFPVTKNAFPTKHGTAERVLFHNGHVSGWEDKLFTFITNQDRNFHGAWSDTRLCALIANKFGSDTMAAMFPSQKFVTFSAKEMIFYGQWEDENDGMIFSNYYWRASQTSIDGAWNTKKYTMNTYPGVRTLPARYRKESAFLDPHYNDNDFPVG